MCAEDLLQWKCCFLFQDRNGRIFQGSHPSWTSKLKNGHTNHPMWNWKTSTNLIDNCGSHSIEMHQYVPITWSCWKHLSKILNSATLASNCEFLLNPNLAKHQVRSVEAFAQSVFSTSVSIIVFLRRKQKLEIPIPNMKECTKSDLKKTSTKSFNQKSLSFNCQYFFQKGTDSLMKKSMPKKCTFERVPSASVPTQKSFLCRAFLGGAVEIPWFFYWENGFMNMVW